MERSTNAKVNAALHVLCYQHNHEQIDLKQAADFLAVSLGHYRTLARLTENTYDFANSSLQTSHRRIPAAGTIDGKPVNFRWTQMLDVYEQELAEFQTKVQQLE